MVKFKNNTNLIHKRNLLYAFCKLHDLELKIIYDEKTRLMTFKIEEATKAMEKKQT